MRLWPQSLSFASGISSLRLVPNAPVPFDPVRTPLRQRAASLALALVVTILMIAAMLSLNGTAPQRPRFKGGPIMVDFIPDVETADVTVKTSARKPEQGPKPPAPPQPIPVAKPLPTPVEHPYFIHLTPEENQAADIARLPHAQGRGDGVQQQANAGDSRPVGTAPDGEPLYEAQWYRRPTHAELSFYLPPHMPVEGWGLVACRTIARYHVDDCVELGSSPEGSRLAGAVRQAAWQFLVRPPRLGGKELVGTWVRIRIDYVAKAVDGVDD